MIRETGYHKYKNRAGKDNSLPAFIFYLQYFSHIYTLQEKILFIINILKHTSYIFKNNLYLSKAALLP